ncbi:MAG: hypothetical protein ABFS32_19555 [Bacteroidota bacterium]
MKVFIMRSNLLITVLLVLLVVSNTSGQDAAASDAKFGGPFTTISFNKNGPSLSVGGGGSFYTIGNSFIGVFGQGTTSAFKRNVELNNESYLMKSRQTGFWLGYKQVIKKHPKLALSLYNKVGFGRVSLDNSQHSISYYDATIVFTPNIEISYRVLKFFELGIAVYYEIFTGVNFYGYSNTDFNSAGASLLLKFRGTE